MFGMLVHANVSLQNKDPVRLSRASTYSANVQEILGQKDKPSKEWACKTFRTTRPSSGQPPSARFQAASQAKFIIPIIFRVIVIFRNRIRTPENILEKQLQMGTYRARVQCTEGRELEEFRKLEVCEGLGGSKRPRILAHERRYRSWTENPDFSRVKNHFIGPKRRTEDHGRTESYVAEYRWSMTLRKRGAELKEVRDSPTPPLSYSSCRPMATLRSEIGGPSIEEMWFKEVKSFKCSHSAQWASAASVKGGLF
ncbi:hypothetical protein B0H19DRAFT_1300815 [Mycena capillaripes]|nr:hypothetical protein B0H19DRAFT_1300815 [Mycena capillaripes]